MHTIDDLWLTRDKVEAILKDNAPWVYITDTITHETENKYKDHFDHERRIAGYEFDAEASGQDYDFDL